MKREFLTELGIEESAIDKIMAENGNDINKHKSQAELTKAELEGLKIQLAERDKDLETLKKTSSEGEDLKASLAELQEKYNTDTAKLTQEKLDAEFSFLLKEKLGGVNAKDIDVVRSILDMDSLKLVNGDIVGLSEQLENLKTNKGFLFDSEEAAPTFSRPSNSQPLQGVTAEQFKKMGYTERLELKNKDLEAYKNLKGD